MLGAIAGDVIGSVFEAFPIKTKQFPLFCAGSRFTDDTVLTVAVADWLLGGEDLARTFHDYVDRYSAAGFGGFFLKWAKSRSMAPYNSWGNGAAMRVSPVGWAFESEEQVLAAADRSAAVTHNHPDGVKGAQATALAVFLARKGETKETMRVEISERFGYDLDRSVPEVREVYRFDVSCEGTVPEALISFLDSVDFEDAVRNAVSLGGDADTLACIAGSVAEAFYGGVPPSIEEPTRELLDADLLKVVDRFEELYPHRGGR